MKDAHILYIEREGERATTQPTIKANIEFGLDFRLNCFPACFITMPKRVRNIVVQSDILLFSFS